MTNETTPPTDRQSLTPALFLLAALAVLLVILLRPAPPAPPEPTGRMLIAAELGDGISYQDYWLDMATGELQPVSFDANISPASQIAVSPDGTQMAFNAMVDRIMRVYVSNMDGTGTRVVSSGPFNTRPRWSPDGRQVVFVRSDHTIYRSALYVVNVETGEEHELVGYENALEADWSPVSDWIVFTTSRDGFQELYLTLPDGTQQTRLTSNDLQNDLLADWSPDGTKIAYQTNYSVGDGTAEVWIMDADGSNQRRLTFNELDDRGHQWSPDGTKIAFTTSQLPPQNFSDVYVYDLETDELHQLTDHPSYDWVYFWSPDGEWIAFNSWREQQNGTLYIMRADGSDVRRIEVGKAPGVTGILWIP